MPLCRPDQIHLPQQTLHQTYPLRSIASRT
jgi:hypothetical protein